MPESGFRVCRACALGSIGFRLHRALWFRAGFLRKVRQGFPWRFSPDAIAAECEVAIDSKLSGLGV